MNNNKPSFLANIPPATLNIIIINLLVWIAAQILPAKFDISLVGMFGMHYFAAAYFIPIPLLTYMFLHDTSSIRHPFFNMFVVYMFGPVLDHVCGW